ncbi:hypothetical protein [Caulobacter endophyticus]|uniref:hypothetical protein n=1 Tax=Caulobacter endophyticus TaxID=2172652 RepID=UPI0024109EA3|nr:hypothetical protein [Caulobacter endophyticus]MDG2530716.1 hypothetical protein [Caulobacter endophyticus]
MITAVALALALGEAVGGGPQADGDLERWEGCAAAAAPACSAPPETAAWRSCLEATDPARPDDWDRCEFVAFSRCFDDRVAGPTGLLLCSAQRVVAARKIADDWIADLDRRGLKDKVERMTALRSLTELRARADLPADQFGASAHRLGTWTSGLRFLDAMRRASQSPTPMASGPSAPLAPSLSEEP